MTLAKISNTGLWVTGILVVVLWGFVLADRLILHAAHLEAIRAMKQIESLQIQRQLKSPRRQIRERNRFRRSALPFPPATPSEFDRSEEPLPVACGSRHRRDQNNAGTLSPL
ncbi:MAG: hypothetical protein JWO80_4820 [Bryobacterales bacterium]|nr:hypothetical protein [Bryobacterales bacterium]